MQISKDLSFDPFRLQKVIRRAPKKPEPDKFLSFNEIKSVREQSVAKAWAEFVTGDRRLGIGSQIDVRR